MSEIEHILLQSNLSPDHTAKAIAEILGAEMDRGDSGQLLLSRAIISDLPRMIVGEVIENDYGEEDPDPGDESIYDTYDNVLELWVSGKTDEELLHTESSRIFDEITTHLPWPAAHTKVSGLLYSAFKPGRGRTDFPPGTGYSARSRDLWGPYTRR